MKKFPAAIKIAFLAIGLAIFVIAALVYADTRRFMDSANSAQGTVVSTQEVWTQRTSARRSDVKYVHYIRFTTADGQLTVFTSEPRSTRLDSGKTVEILYQPGNPADALSRELTSPWAPVVGLAMMSGVFASIAALIFSLESLSKRRKNHLKQHGVLVKATFRSLKINRALTVNGEHPFILTCTWHDPETAKSHAFRSGNMWGDSSAHLRGREFDVYMSSGNPRKHYIDLSFLADS